MIIDGPITFDLTVGADRRIPSFGDGQTLIPPSIQPVVLALRPHTTPALGEVVSDSFVQSFLITRTNQAGVSTLINTLRPGLWELELTLSSWMNFSETAGLFARIDVEYIFPNATQVGLSRFCLINSSFVDFQRNRILLIRPMSINLRLPLTGVGQSIDALVTINAIRII